MSQGLSIKHIVDWATLLEFKSPHRGFFRLSPHFAFTMTLLSSGPLLFWCYDGVFTDLTDSDSTTIKRPTYYEVMI